MDVTVVTTGAMRADGLSEADYMDIFREIREKMSLRKFVEVIGSQYSIAWWGKYENGEVKLTRAGKGELRRAVGLGELPRTVTEVTAEVDPDATVWGITSGDAGAEGLAPGQYVYDRVVLVGRGTHGPLTIHLNGRLTIEDEPRPAPEGDVTPVTGARTKRNIGRICLSRPAWERLNAARLRAGVSWEEFLARLEVE